MSKNDVAFERWAIMYCHSTASSKFLTRRIFKNYGLARELFKKGCEYIQSDYDGYNYVALLWDSGDDVKFIPIAWVDNIGNSWFMEGFVDG